MKNAANTLLLAAEVLDLKQPQNRDIYPYSMGYLTKWHALYSFGIYVTYFPKQRFNKITDELNR